MLNLEKISKSLNQAGHKSDLFLIRVIHLNFKNEGKLGKSRNFFKNPKISDTKQISSIFKFSFQENQDLAFLFQLES